MHYMNRKREKRRTEPIPPGRRGFRMTAISLAAVGAFIAVTKAKNPGMDLKPMLMMFGGVTAACVLMHFVSNRKRRDDE